MAGNDLSAIGALHAAYNLRLDVPRDLSIVGFDDIEFARYTSVAVPRGEIGRLAFDALNRPMKNPERAGEEYRVHTQLSLRQSTAAPCPTRKNG